MVINVDEVKQFVDYISNKEQSGTITPKQFNLLCRRANDDLFRIRYGLTEDYQPGRPLPRQAYQITQKITDDLSATLKTARLTIDSNGFAALPADYVHKSSIEYNKVTNNSSGGFDEELVPVEIVDDNKFPGRRSNSLKAPDKDYPIVRFKANQLQFNPKDLQRVDLSYLSYPAAPVWAFTTANTIPLYDSANSTNFEWNAILTNDIVRLILSYVGINLKDADLTSYIESIKAKGA